MHASRNGVREAIQDQRHSAPFLPRDLGRLGVMADTPDTSISVRALQKIGRNVLNLQKMEGMLKRLVAFADIKGSSSELQNQLNELRDSVSKKTMGVVVGELCEKIYSEAEELEGPPDLKEPWMSFRFRIEASEESVDALKDAFATLVEERNDLIHHKLLKFDVHSMESCVELISALDAQNDRIRPIYDYLQDQLKSLGRMGSVTRQALEKDFFGGDHADS